MLNLHLASFSYLAAAGSVNQKHTKHDKNILNMKYLANYTVDILSSNQQILWEARKVRLTEKNGLFPIPKNGQKVDSKCSKFT